MSKNDIAAEVYVTVASLIQRLTIGIDAMFRVSQFSSGLSSTVADGALVSHMNTSLSRVVQLRAHHGAANVDRRCNHSQRSIDETLRYPLAFAFVLSALVSPSMQSIFSPAPNCFVYPPQNLASRSLSQDFTAGAALFCCDDRLTADPSTPS
jgi:hypothetical protein